MAARLVMHHPYLFHVKQIREGTDIAVAVEQDGMFAIYLVETPIDGSPTYRPYAQERFISFDAAKRFAESMAWQSPDIEKDETHEHQSRQEMGQVSTAQQEVTPAQTKRKRKRQVAQS